MKRGREEEQLWRRGGAALVLLPPFTLDAIKLTREALRSRPDRVSVADALLRQYVAFAKLQSLPVSPSLLPLSQLVLESNYCWIEPCGTAYLHLGRIHQQQCECADVEGLLAHLLMHADAVHRQWRSVQDQESARAQLAGLDAVCFVCDGSMLARDSGESDLPLSTALPFLAPPSLRALLHLPHAGPVEGMLIKEGVTVVTGGGFHGKSTLLAALAVGGQNKVPGDGRELCVSTALSVCVRAEEGRHVSCVDLSAFLSSLPAAAAATPARFSTRNASGSTSQAAAVVEALETGARLLLLDEDSCANNFMVRDSRMRSLVPHETITPFSYRVNGLMRDLGVSTVIVTGGCGDWLDVQDTCLLLDNYACTDATQRARSISKTFCTGRVQYNGQGLVHQLRWDCRLPRRSLCAGSARALLAESCRVRGEGAANGATAAGLSAAVRRALELAVSEEAAGLSVPQLMQLVDASMDEGGGLAGLGDACEGLLRPRALDVMAALFRLRGIVFDSSPELCD